MFWILAIVGLIAAGFGVWLKGWENRTAGIPIAVLGVGLVVLSLLTPQWKIYWRQISASGQESVWLVVDNSGGETLRHWLTRTYLKSATQSDGWEFLTCHGMAYASGDSFVLRLDHDQFTAEFLGSYKEVYGIPEDSKPICGLPTN